MLERTRRTISTELEQGLRILHLSDLHGAWFGRKQEELIHWARETQPDVIAVTGDFIDNTCGERPAVALMEGLAMIAPVYCVTGNHEEREMTAGAESYERLIGAFGHMDNAHLLRGKTLRLTREITLTGADDFDFIGGKQAYPGYLKKLYAGAEGKFRILLAHRPEMFDAYAGAGFDLTLAGHAHGGQIRLPWGRGLFAPGQGFFPRLTGGVYEHANGKRMHVSRGLGNSVPVPRINNAPEATLLELRGRKSAAWGKYR